MLDLTVSLVLGGNPHPCLKLPDESRTGRALITLVWVTHASPEQARLLHLP